MQHESLTSLTYIALQPLGMVESPKSQLLKPFTVDSKIG